jgi:hypothetical protein
MDGNDPAFSGCSEGERVRHCGRRAGKEIRWDGNSAERRSGSFHAGLHGSTVLSLLSTNNCNGGALGVAQDVILITEGSEFSHCVSISSIRRWFAVRLDRKRAAGVRFHHYPNRYGSRHHPKIPHNYGSQI